MDQHLQPIIEYLRQHPHVGELFAFVVAFAESLPLIGTVVPGTITMTAVGILIGTGALPGILTLIIVSVAAFAGDSIGFVFGYYYNARLLTIWPFKKYPHWITMSEDFFEKHGGKSILIGRFVGPARSTVPLVAGFLKLSWLRFVCAAIPSGILWAIVYTLPGVLLGALSREIPAGETTEFLIGGIIVIAVLCFVFWMIQHFFVNLVGTINVLTDKFWAYLSRKKGCRAFIRLITNQQEPSDHHQLTLFIAALLSTILFIILLINVIQHGVLTKLNAPIFHLLQSTRLPALNRFFVVITIMGKPITMIMIAGIMTAALFIKKQWRAAYHLLTALFLSVGAVFFFKLISHSQRPQHFNIITNSSSFPSGHTTMSFVVYSMIAFLFVQIMPKTYRWIPYTLTGIIVFLVSISRLYLGAHWFSDIIGSLLLGLSIIFVCIISYRRMPKAKSTLLLSPNAATIILCVSLLISWGINIPRELSANLYRTTPIWPTQQINIQHWWESPLQYTPLYRKNRLGKPFQPFNVQWQGSLKIIKQTLIKNGWQTIPNHPKLKTTLRRFASFQAEYHMPLLPWLYRDKPPALLMIRHIPKHNAIIELRLWQSGIRFNNIKYPLWIGATDMRLPPTKLISIDKRAKISLAEGGGLRQLNQDTQLFQRKMIQVTSYKKQPKKILPLHWYGHILLIRNTPL